VYDSTMISKLTGTLDSHDDKKLIIDVHGVGYRVYATSDTLHSITHLTGTDTPLSLHIHSVIREDAFDLYGFAALEDLALFELLISVSGIGPKTALGVLSMVSSNNLRRAIQEENVSSLTKVAGIGKKIAEKIILELKDKINSLDHIETTTDTAPSAHADAIEALSALGYSPQDARDALKKIDPALTTTASKVRAALKVLT